MHTNQSHAERQYWIDSICAQYTDEYRANKGPVIDDYLKRYPAYVKELISFWLYFHCIAVDMPEPGAVPVAELSSAAKAALAQIKARVGQEE